MATVVLPALGAALALSPKRVTVASAAVVSPTAARGPGAVSMPVRGLRWVAKAGGSFR